MIGNEKSKSTSQSTTTLWQHPYVDVFKYFKIIPNGDWKQNKKQGDVQDIFAKEIGRKAISIQGSISANNYILMPHPNSLMKVLNLTGRYLYLEVKSSNSGNPFSFHFDFGMADRSHNVRISVSNLFKNFSTSNGFVIQVPLELLQTDKWTVVCLDIFELMKKSQLFPQSYKLEGSHSLKSMMLCSNIQVRGAYTSDNFYDYITLPSDMRFKFSFDINRWEEFFNWINLPADLDSLTPLQSSSRLGSKGIDKEKQREEERKHMQQEIDQLLQKSKKPQVTEEDDVQIRAKQKSRIGTLPEIQNTIYQQETYQPASGYIVEERPTKRSQQVNLQGLANKSNDYVIGQYIGADLKRSAKLNQDPILELKHIIGFSPDKCMNLKWSRYQNENVVLFTSGGTLIAMDVNQNEQKRFFFGHSGPIVCFDINANGTLLASAQEGKNTIIRIWEYTSGRCISMVTMPVNQLKCLSFSYDGKYLASVGKDSHNRELVIVWDISGISKGEKPEIVAKQTSDFNILCLKFSPIDSTRMASCGKENIRFWRIKENGVIRGSAVVLNHHARNTVFTSLDFEYGALSVDPKENESLKRLFVGSKHGMVFQINYHTESLEATYQTNDAAIYSIAVNEAFCVTGSEDTYLRVWPLDFSEFFMEAKHEGTVCSVDISTDGLKVVCGTTYGSLGILDKSNQKYRTLLRSHTDMILNMDFHAGKNNIITVSKDRTIRLWDVENFDQVYEFSSPIDQALSVAAHPQLPLFSCGFESGVMRVFDIERTCVADEFTQFNKPLMKLAYSPLGDLLVTCCQDGGVAIHNARRQHQPIKMMHLEFPPEFVHVAFTTSHQQTSMIQDQNENRDPNETQYKDAKFAIMGEYGNNVNIFDTESFIVRHQIQANHILRAFQFANNNREIVLVTNDCKIRFYSLAKFEGIFLREISTVHRGNIVSLNISNNSGYMLTGGEDNMVKVWDYEANKTLPYFFQSFIGHIYPVKNLIFNPLDNSQVFSAGEKDGIYVWSFYGDIKSKFYHEEESLAKSQSQPKMQIQQQSILERMRNTRKEQKQQQQQLALNEDTFILPSFKPLSQIEQLSKEEEQINLQEEEMKEQNKQRQQRQLTNNHFAGTGKQFDFEKEPILFNEGEEQERVIDSYIVNGYDGFGGVHSNLVWNSEEGWAAYTLHNKVIFENTKTREQQVFSDSTTQLSSIMLSPDQKLLAVAEGQSNKSGNSYIFIYSTKERKLLQKLTFHQKGVQALAFSNCSNFLISIGVQGENTLAIWDISQGLVIKSALIKHYATNAIKVDPYIEEGYVMFCTVGNHGSFSFWRLDLDQLQLQTYDVDLPFELQTTNFTYLAFTPYLPSPYNTYLILLVASDGSMIGYDQKQNHFVDNAQKKYCLTGEIEDIICKNNYIVLTNSQGIIARYQINNSEIFPQDSKMFSSLKADASITSISMDSLNNEGLVGTVSGSIYYINFQDKMIIKIIQKACQYQDEISIVKVYQQNPSLFLTSCGSKSSQVKLWTTSTVDQVMKFSSMTCSPVAFILSSSNKFTLIGQQDGMIKVVCIESLKIEGQYQLQLGENENVSSGTFNSNGINFAIGTNQGNVFMGSVKEEVNGQPKILIGKLENISKTTVNSITSLQFSLFDPIGSFLVAFDNGIIKTWQSSVRNDQFMKLLELQQQQQEQKTIFDLSECGYQQFDLIDNFNMFENPHGLEDIGDTEKQQLKLLYANKKYKQCQAIFAPKSTSADIYLSFVSSLQYIYLRNYITKSIVKRVSLMHFPTCLSVIDYNTLMLENENIGGESVISCVGTKEGKILVYKISTTGHSKLFETRGGLSYGSICGLDITQNAEKMIGTTESGEILIFNLVDNLSEE